MPIRKMFAPLLIAALLGAPSVLALDLDEAKSRGLVGETSGGYLAPVVSSAEVEALVESINSQRKAQYEKIAKKNGISLSAVEALAGKKAVEKTPAGEYISTGTGWEKK